MAQASASASKGSGGNSELFTDSNIGTPWKIWVEKDVSNRSNLVEQIQVCFSL